MKIQELLDFIDEHHDRYVTMSKNPQSTSSKRSRPECSPPSPTSPGTFEEILESIDTKLASFDAQLALVEVLHREFQGLRDSLEYSQQQLEGLTAENKVLSGAVENLNHGLAKLSEENKALRETVLDLQSRSMRDNLVFAGPPEQAEEDAESTLREFIQVHLKLPTDTVKNITFAQVHRLGGKRPTERRPRAIVAKFEHFKRKELEGVLAGGLALVRGRGLPSCSPTPGGVGGSSCGAMDGVRVWGEVGVWESVRGCWQWGMSGRI